MNKQEKDEIVKILLGKNGAVEKYKTERYPSLMPEQAAKKIEKGKKFKHKGADVHAVDGKHIRTNPDDTKNNNLVPRK